MSDEFGPPPPVPPMPLGYAVPIAQPGAPTFPQQAARASWVAPVVAIGLGCLTNSSLQESSRIGGPVPVIVGLVSLFLILIGMVSGIVALAGMRGHGRKGILVPALIGLTVNGSFLILIMLGFLSALSNRPRPVPPSPPPAPSVQPSASPGT